MADDINVTIGAQIDGLTTGLNAATSAVQNSASAISSQLSSMAQASVAASTQIQNSFSQMASVITSSQNLLLGFVGLLSGGAFFQHAISSSLAFNKEISGLAIGLGKTRDQALILDAAIKMSGITTNDYTTALTRLETASRDGEDRLNQLGVKTRDLSGHLLTGTSLIQSAGRALEGYRAGLDQGRAAGEIFGTTAAAAAGIMGVTEEAIRNAETVLRAFNIQLADPSAIQKYDAQMSLLNYTMQRSWDGIANQLIPVLTKLAGWFNDIGPVAAKFFGDALLALAGIVTQLQYAFAALLNTAETGWEQLKAIVSGEWDLVGGIGERGAAVDAELRKIRDANAGKLSMDLDVTAKSPLKSGGKEYTPPDKKTKGAGGDDRMSVFRDELRDQLQTEQHFFDDSKAEELKFWQAKLAIVGTGSKEDLKLRREINAEIFNLQKGLAKQTEQDALSTLTSEQRLGDLLLSRKRAQLQVDQNLGRISAQEEISGEKALVAAELAADLDYYAKKRAAAEGDTRTLQKLAEQEKLDHEKLISDKIALDNKALEESHTTWMQIGDSISQAVDRSVMGVIQGTNTIGQAFRNLGQSILAEFVNLGIKKAVSSLFNSIFDSFGGAAGGGIGGIFGSLLGGLPLIGGLFGGGLQSASFSSMLLSLPAFEKGGIASAAGGWRVPSTGGMAMLHKNEMVLPSHISTGLQNMIGAGGGGGDIHFHATAMDASFARMVTGAIQQNPGAIRGLFKSNAITPRNS